MQLLINEWNNVFFVLMQLKLSKRKQGEMLEVGGPSKQDFKNFDPLNTRIRHPKGRKTHPKISNPNLNVLRTQI